MVCIFKFVSVMVFEQLESDTSITLCNRDLDPGSSVQFPNIPDPESPHVVGIEKKMLLGSYRNDLKFGILLIWPFLFN